MKRPILTPAALDEILEGKAHRSACPTLATESLWGAKAIGQFMGISEDTVPRMKSRDPTFPVRRRGGKLYATKTEILRWLLPSSQDSGATN